MPSAFVGRGGESVKRLLIAQTVWVLIFGVKAARAQSRGAETEVRAVLEKQVAAWNGGDVQGFMEGYWNSPRTTFAGANGVLRGWQKVLERYRRDYPDRSAMGTLRFSNLEITVLSPHAALVLGHWELERSNDRPGGVFTLVLRQLPQGWRIIHDHTSVVGGHY